MRKLKLAIDDLRVESFDTSETRAERRGTVAAHMPKPKPPQPPLVETYYVGETCECTLMQSCVLTNCILECIDFTADCTV